MKIFQKKFIYSNLLLFLTLLLSISTYTPVKAENYVQERAVIHYSNPKFLASLQATTGRASRGASYRTNVTMETLQVWGNNVTITASFFRKGGGSSNDIMLHQKVCDFVKSKWMKEFMQMYSNLAPGVCPIPAKVFKFFNIELPPRGFPLALPKGSLTFNVSSHHTITKERIYSLLFKVHSK